MAYSKIMIRAPVLVRRCLACVFIVSEKSGVRSVPSMIPVVFLHIMFSSVLLRRLQKCLLVRMSDTTPTASVGCAQRSWERTTEFFQHRVWCSVWQLHMPLTAALWLLGSPGWWPGRCLWLLANTYLSTHRRTARRPDSNLSAGSSKQTTKASTRS